MKKYLLYINGWSSFLLIISFSLIFFSTIGFSQKSSEFYLEAKKQMALGNYCEAYVLMNDSLLYCQDFFHIKNFNLDMFYSG